MTSVSSSKTHGFGNAVFFWLGIFRRQFHQSMSTESSMAFFIRNAMEWAFQAHFKADWVWIYLVKSDFSDCFQEFFGNKIVFGVSKDIKWKLNFHRIQWKKPHTFKKLLLLSQKVTLKSVSFHQVFSWDLMPIFLEFNSVF